MFIEPKMVWPVLLIVAIIVVIVILLYRKDQGQRGFPLNRYCLECHKRFPDNLSVCPYCGEKYFSSRQK